MAERNRVKLSEHLRVTFRAADPELTTLQHIVFSRYPDKEWATFIRCGWREFEGGLVLTLAIVDAARDGDMDPSRANVGLLEPYSRRIALTARDGTLAVGLVHSHPEDFAPCPSRLDDDMDTYYAEQYLVGFAPGRPFVSLILAREANALVASGRVYWKGEWHAVQRILLERMTNRTWVNGRRPPPDDEIVPRTARLSSFYGTEAAARLRRATVAVVGAGGTGSAAIEVLARAGVGRLILLDSDYFEPSNLERVHGSTPDQAKRQDPKVAVAKAHLTSITPDCEVVAIKGSIPQSKVIDLIAEADVLLGCTDTQHSRLAVSDIARRFLVPAIDIGVVFEGECGRVTAQVLQLRRCLAADPCARCRRTIDQMLLNQELMTEEDRRWRRVAAQEALEKGEPGGPYWQEEPQLDTVGFLTTAAGAIAAGYAIGWIAGRFDTPFELLEVCLLTPYLVKTGLPREPNCDCGKARGWADQGNRYSLITAPAHWPEPIVLT